MKNILFILLAFLSVSFRLYAQDCLLYTSDAADEL